MRRHVWRVVIGALLVGSVVAEASAQEAGKKPLTIEAIFAEGGITGRAPENLEWSPDGKRFAYVQRDDPGEHGELWAVDAASGQKTLLVSEAKLASLAPPMGKIKDEREKERLTRYHVAAYQWTPDGKQLLFDSQGQLWLFALDNGTGIQLTSAPEPSEDPKFSPDGSRLAYVRQHNLYVRNIAGKEEKQLTRDHDENLLNGEVDWVYAEELGVRSNYFWSPNGKQLVFLQMDETQVPTYPITDWLPTHPNLEKEKYPKAGDRNPAVRLGVINASGGKPKWIALTEDTDIYVPRFGWLRDGWLWAQVLNRAQDRLDLYFVDAGSGKSRKVLSELDPTGWINISDDMRVLKSSNRFTWSSWRDGHTHLYLYSFNAQNPLAADAQLERQLTQGDFEMLGVEGIDEAAGVVYFSANQGDPRQQQVYSVKLDGSGMMRVSQGDGTHVPKFAEDGRHYVDRYSRTLTPPRVDACGSDGSCKDVWAGRDVAEYGLTPPKFMEFKTDDNTTLYGELLLPPQAAGKVPLIVHIYGGPAAQVVRNEWGGATELFHEIMVQRGFAIFSVDNRGTPGRDRKFQTAIRREFGEVELHDQVTALDQLFAQYPQLDRDRVAIWGWSNGASMTLYALTHSEMFKAGVAVAPVTDWHNYDSIYTERYQGLPQDHGKGYEDMALPKQADKLHGSLLLVHGTSDDNVHFQNTVQMVDALIKASKQFHLMMYPNKTHGIAGTAARVHLFHMIEDHFEQSLK